MVSASGTTRRRAAILALVAGAVGIGFAPIFVRISETGPVATAFWRMALAVPFYFAALRRSGGFAEAGSLAAMVGAGACFAADLTAWHVSIATTTVANATFLVNLAPVVVAIGAWAFLRERVRPSYFVGAIGALIGAAILVHSSHASRTGSTSTFGDALATLAAVFYASYQLCIKVARRTAATETILCISGITASIALLVAAIVRGERIFPHDLTGWFVLVANTVICQLLGQTLITFGTAALPATFASLGLLVQPFSASIFGWVFLGEGLSERQWIGGIVILTGIIIARDGTTERAAADAEPGGGAPVSNGTGGSRSNAPMPSSHPPSRER